MTRQKHAKRRASTTLVLLFLLPLILTSLPPFKDSIFPVQATPLTALGIWSPANNSTVIIDPSVLPQAQLQLRVNASGGTDIGGFDITVQWDPAVLNGTSVTAAGGIFDRGSEFFTITQSVQPDQIRFSGALLGNFIPANGTVFTMTVKVVGTGSTSITINRQASILFLGPTVIPFTPLDGFFSNTPGTGDLSLASVIVDREIVTLGETLTIVVGVRNIGTILMADVVVRIFANSTMVDSTSLGAVAPNTGQSPVLSWNTTGFSAGVYNITATVSTTSQDVFSGDNRLSLERVNVVIHNLRIVSINTDSSSIIVNSTVRVNVVARNTGTIRDNANASIYANNTLVSSVQRNPIDPGRTWTFTFNWNTTGMSLGRYTLEARVTVVPGELDANDNVLAYGIVSIKLSFEHDLAIIGSLPNVPLTVGTNQTLSFIVKNNGIFDENYALKIFVANQIVFQSSGVLAPSQNTTLSFVWRTITHQPGIYSVKVNVTATADEFPVNDQISGGVSLSPNRPPVASFTFSLSSPRPGDSILFNASASSDPDGTIRYYIWDFGDGTTAGGRTANHTYSSEGTYTVKLTVWDNYGGQHTLTQTVDVKPSGIPLTVYVGTAGVAGAVAAGILLLLRKRRLRPQPAQQVQSQNLVHRQL